ncbi:MAG: asparagine synthase (glutamine-hydrolyzing) [bacterium]
MCGIVGIVTKESSANGYEAHIKKMMASIKYRGPDEDGVHIFDTCALGHVRLSIVDLGSGQQPMLTSDKTNSIVFNGEIYGYKDIKKTLSEYNFDTNSDTEVILALYKKYGHNLLEKLPGMFAFALWDEKKKELFCVRDRFGEKPFFYAYGKNGEFIFASEIKAILASDLVEPVIDPESVAHYLKHLYVNPYKTIYSNIFTLPPAHSLTYTDEKVSVQRYWQPPVTNKTISLDEAAATFKNLFSKAVRSQLVADVPVGAFLSGGLDSSSVVAVASQYQKKLKTLSFRFKDGFNELPFAKEIADKYDTDHVEMHDTDHDIGALLLKMRDIFDEPFADSSNISTYLISKQASRHVKVVLTGDGGDELLGGYSGWYKPFLYAEKDSATMPQWLSAMMPYLTRGLHKARIPYRNELCSIYAGTKLKKEFTSVITAHEAQNTYFTDTELDSLFLKKTSGKKYTPYWQSANTLDDVMHMDIDNYMPGDILTKIDRASMANSIELRAPFLDRDFASFCLSLPYTLKIDKKSEKIVLRKALADYLTDSILTRDKQGFGAPVHRWLKLDTVKKVKNEYLTDQHKKIFDLLSYDAVQKMAEKDNYQTWALLVLAIWLENKIIHH